MEVFGQKRPFRPIKNFLCVKKSYGNSSVEEVGPMELPTEDENIEDEVFNPSPSSDATEETTEEATDKESLTVASKHTDGYPISVYVEPDSPHRCQRVKRTKQCRKQRLHLPDGAESQYCYGCGGWRDLKRMEKEEFALYRTQKYASRIKSMADHASARTLKDEVGILRMLLEEELQGCKNSEELIRKTPQLMNILDRITKAVPASAKLDIQTGNTISKTAAAQLGDEIIKIISDNITDPDILTDIANSIGEAISRAGTPTED